MELALSFILGFIAGSVIVLIIVKLQSSSSKDTFSDVSLTALNRVSDEFIKIASEKFSASIFENKKEMEEKKLIIDKSLTHIHENLKEELSKVKDLMSSLEKDRAEKFGEINNIVKKATEETAKLHETADELKKALTNSKARGNWGERMAEDILRLTGLIENVNYVKQKTLENSSTRPDFTFFLPQGLKVNMDVKFPFDNYLKFIKTESDLEKENFKTLFLRDIRNQIKEVTTRNYINPQEDTVDYVLVFIPNEQIYSFLNEADKNLLDEALKNKVILCSPISLYAILSLIRQAIDNFNLERTSGQILKLFSGFYKNWEAYLKTFERMGKKIEETQEEFNNLATTRKNMLDRSFKKIDELRKEKGIEYENVLEGEVLED